MSGPTASRTLGHLLDGDPHGFDGFESRGARIASKMHLMFRAAPIGRISNPLRRGRGSFAPDSCGAGALRVWIADNLVADRSAEEFVNGHVN